MKDCSRRKDQFGYNELAFEDKRGEEVLSLRAQKDFKLHAQNNQYVQIDNNTRTIIGNDETRTIKNNSSQTVGKDSTRCIVQNDIKVVEKEEIHTIQEDKELHVLKDFNTIVKDNHKTIVEHDMITRVKGILHKYVEKDVKQKYLSNTFMQIGKDYRLDVQNAYHLKSKHIKHTTNTFEIEAQEAISLRVGGSVLTVDTSGIHLKSPVVDTSSGNAGVVANVVAKPEILKPLYNKIKVTNLSVDVVKQSEITDVLTFTAEVEVYENDVWVAKTELTQTQQSQLQWVFIKNNDSEDKDILLDNPTDDNITIEGLTMTVIVEKENVFKYGHGHCYVVDSEKEGYAVSELKRYLEVEEILEEYTSDNEEGECTAILNIDEPRAEELAQIRWTVENKNISKYNGQKVIVHNLKEENVYEINFTAYIDGKTENAANAMLVYDKINDKEVKLNETQNNNK